MFRRRHRVCPRRDTIASESVVCILVYLPGWTRSLETPESCPPLRSVGCVCCCGKMRQCGHALHKEVEGQGKPHQKDERTEVWSCTRIKREAGQAGRQEEKGEQYVQRLPL